MSSCSYFHFVALLAIWLPFSNSSKAFEFSPVEGQPLAAQVKRALEALDFLGAPLPAGVVDKLQKACAERDARSIQAILDEQILVEVNISPEARVKVKRGRAEAVLQQHGYVPYLVKVVNESSVTKPLKVSSPQAGPVYSGGGAGKVPGDKDRFFLAEMFAQPPMSENLSGLAVEYVILLAYSSEVGIREVTLGFDVGQGSQDLGFRGQTPVLFKVRPAVPVTLRVLDEHGKPSVGRFTFQDRLGHVFPAQAKRTAPDFFFQKQIYRQDGAKVYLPPGDFTMTYCRGPEYVQKTSKIVIPEKGPHEIQVRLERWLDPSQRGFYSGDHHIHAAGCAHYTNPTEGVFAQDMFLHVKGEGLNVGCNLTWGPCYEFQRQFFEPGINKLSEPFTVLKYDIEVSGFGSQALGHVCLLNLKDQTYPGSDGTKTKGWPTWTTPLMRWAKNQGAVTGYAHSANGLAAIPERNAQRFLEFSDTDKDGAVSRQEAMKALLPLTEPFEKMDVDRDGVLTRNEILQSSIRMADKLPNYLIPEMDGIGAQEIAVTTAQGLCDFISAMDTHRVREWNCWYHLMNCGFPLKASGETDFPCISGSRVGQGRVYVQMGRVDRVDFAAWCEGVAKGRSYVSDGYAHALEFKVQGNRPGTGEVKLKAPQKVKVEAEVTFAAEMPLGTAVGGTLPDSNKRLVELVVNGEVAASVVVPADGSLHKINFEPHLTKSSWVALRSYPQLHTNPVVALVDEKPVRASKKSAQWCAGMIEQLWRVRKTAIADPERPEAEKTFQAALAEYRRIYSECRD